MRSGIEQLALKLESEIGAEAVTAEPNLLNAYVIDGVTPSLFCSPDSLEKCAAALRLCTEADAAVTPWGGGTAMRLGNLPRRLDVVLGLTRLNRLIEHDAANLTVTVQSGITLMALQETLAEQNQFLPFEPPLPARATIGGVIAANLNGPRRALYGSVRDLVLGMKIALISGEQIKAGGKVVKNVAGYDMCKLFVGSLGTLGIIGEVTVKLLPVPRRSSTFIATGSLSQIFQFTKSMSDFPLLPASFFILNDAAAQNSGVPGNSPLAAVRFDGFEEAVRRQLDDTEAMAKRTQLTGQSISEPAQARLWEYVRDFSLSADRLVYRLTLPLSKLPEVVENADRQTGGDSSACMIADAASGVFWLSFEPADVNVKPFTDLTSLARSCGGHTVISSAPPRVKQGIDVWGAPPPNFNLMRQIKQQFDPKGLLNPGRFVGSL